MKKLFLFVITVCASMHVFAQFKLSGKLSNITKTDTFYINIPYLYGYYHDNDVAIPVDAKGNFSIDLPLKQQKFGNIRFKGRAVTLLLTPGKALTMNYNAADSSANFSGIAAPENRLLYKADLNSVPFFAKGDKNNTYAGLTLPELQQQVIKPWAATRDKNIKAIQQSDLSIADKALIIQEIKANYILQLNSFARLVMTTDREQIFGFIKTFYKGVPLAPDVLPAGPMYYQFADSYIGYYEALAFKGLTPGESKDPKTLLRYYNISIDSGNRVAKLKGKLFVNGYWYVIIILGILPKAGWPKAFSLNAALRNWLMPSRLWRSYKRHIPKATTPLTWLQRSPHLKRY